MEAFRFGYEVINDDYRWCRWGPFTMVVDSNDRFNVSHLCSDAGKTFKDWSRLVRSQETMDDVRETYRRISPDLEIMKVVTTGINEIRGTYVHEDIIIAVAIWISTKYYRQVVNIIKNYHNREMRDDYERRLGIRDTINEDLRNQMNQLRLQNQELMERTNNVLGVVTKTRDELQEARVEANEAHAEANEAHEELENQMNRVHDKLDEIAPRIVPDYKANSVKENVVIFRVEPNKYKITTCQTKSISGVRSRIRANFPTAVEIYTLTPTPNSKNFWSRLKTTYGRGPGTVNRNAIIKFSASNFSINPGFNEAILINKCTEIALEGRTMAHI